MHDPEFDNPELMADIEKDNPPDIARERLTTQARRYLEAEDKAVALEAEAGIARKAADELEREFWERLDEDATPTVTLELGDPHGRVQFQRRETIRTRIIDKDAAAKAIREAGYDYMLEPVGFRKRPLNQHVRECLRSGAELFDGVDFSRTKYVQISRR
jgi:hypothetical protein